MKLTKQEFIVRAMNGEKFKDEDGNVYFYDESKLNPFRIGTSGINGLGSYFGDGKTEFELVEPKGD